MNARRIMRHLNLNHSFLPLPGFLMLTGILITASLLPAIAQPAGGGQASLQKVDQLLSEAQSEIDKLQKQLDEARAALSALASEASGGEIPSGMTPEALRLAGLLSNPGTLQEKVESNFAASARELRQRIEKELDTYRIEAATLNRVDYPDIERPFHSSITLNMQDTDTGRDFRLSFDVHADADGNWSFPPMDQVERWANYALEQRPQDGEQGSTVLIADRGSGEIQQAQPADSGSSSSSSSGGSGLRPPPRVTQDGRETNTGGDSSGGSSQAAADPGQGGTTQTTPAGPGAGDSQTFRIEWPEDGEERTTRGQQSAGGDSSGGQSAQTAPAGGPGNAQDTRQVVWPEDQQGSGSSGGSGSSSTAEPAQPAGGPQADRTIRIEWD